LVLIGFGVWSWFILSNPTTPGEAAKQANLLEAVYNRGNYIEAGIWSVIGIGFTVRAVRTSGIVKYQSTLAAVTFFLFGLSDIIEVQTGAWWHPWWLFVWKSLCCFSMVGLLIAHLRTKN
jgi:hypothetical protein